MHWGISKSLPMCGGSSGSRICNRFLENLCWLHCKLPGSHPTVAHQYGAESPWLIQVLSQLLTLKNWNGFWYSRKPEGMILVAGLLSCCSDVQYDLQFRAYENRDSKVLFQMSLISHWAHYMEFSSSWWIQDLQVIQQPWRPLVLFSPMFQILTRLFHGKYLWTDWCYGSWLYLYQGSFRKKICAILSTIYLSCAQPFHTNVGSIV